MASSDEGIQLGPGDALGGIGYRGAAGGKHCEIFNRSMANRKILNWLDDTLTTTPTA